MENQKAMIDAIYKFWFGEGDLSSATYKHNGKVWWSALPEVDKRIANEFSDVVEKALAKDAAFEEWKATDKGTVALMLLLDQFPRNMFRGTPRMFEGDEQAMALTKEAIAKKVDERLSLPERLFIYMPFQHTENANDADLGVTLSQHLIELSTTNGQRDKYTKVYGSFKKHAAILHVYGRYPHRNQLLGRMSTPEEVLFLKKHLTTSRFMKSVSTSAPVQTPSVDDASNTSGAPVALQTVYKKDETPPAKKPVMKVLMLHSFRQNASVMKKRTGKLRKAFAAEGIEIIYVNAPIPYEAQDEDREAVLKAFGNLPATEHQRVFWTSKDDNNVYEGVDVSIRYFVELFAAQGPFAGIIAFSHGAAMASILAALQPFESVAFQFCILISGFPPRALPYRDMFNPNCQKLPSMHILGHKDLLVDNERTRALAQAFEGSVLLEHSSGHFVPDWWPVEPMAKFAAKFLPKNSNGENGHKQYIVLNDFIAKLEATIMENKLGMPVGISEKARSLLNSELWKIWLSSPLDITREMLYKWVVQALEIASSPEEQDVIVEDLFVIGYSGRFEKMKKIAKDSRVQTTHDLFFQLVTFLYLLSKRAARLLGLMTRYCGWRDLVGIALQAHYIAAEGSDAIQTQQVETLKQEIIQLFASQLAKDLSAIEKPHGMPSNCVKGAPRLQSCADKEFHLALRVALSLHPVNENVPELTKKIRAEKKYVNTLKVLSERLQQASAVDATRKQLKRTALETAYAGQFGKATPIPSFIKNPEPEPVTVAPLEELEPLFAHLRNKHPVPQQISFVRGSLLPDGRLDLCKMVVGGTGIKPLLDAMCGNDSVKRLLLGNNVVGNQGAEHIAQFIEHGSKLTCWYIAGNNITAEGIKPICEVLEGDTLVEQLWLKRNPLMPEGAVPVANLLLKNSYLQVLDLVNTGLLDEGACKIFEALEQNTALRHLYIGSNGITAASGATIGNYLAKHNRLQSLFLSLNRLGDEGAIKIAEALREDTTLERISLASNRLTAKGVSALVDVVKTHPKIVFLDLGFTKATTAVGEMGNMMGDGGAAKIAELLRENSTLRSLDLVHNNIGQNGLNNIRDALRTNTTLTTLNIMQYGKASNELVKEETKMLIKRNCDAAGPNLPTLQKIDFPDHIVEILSVYRTHM